MPLRSRVPLSLVLSLAAFAGCFKDPPAAPPDVTEAPDVAVADAPTSDLTPDTALDASSDLARADVTPDDTITDVAAEAAPPDGPHCATDRDCTDASSPRCQISSGRCVRCLASDDCPRGQHCDPASNACATGCAADTDCRRGADDAGAGPVSRCDTTHGQCIECSTDDECPVRTICSEGQCVPGCNERRGCSVGESCCRNVCADLTRDMANCGACGTRCDAPNGVASCTTGRCALDACTTGFADCNGDLVDGCEVNLNTDPHSCGHCGTSCPDVANAAVACASGRCGFACRAGFADCDGNGANGCERNLDADPTSCGHCGTMCPTPPGAQTILCGMGACAFSCRPGLGNCDGDPANGCETDIQSTATHCGACDNGCLPRPHASSTCSSARCLLHCDTGYGDCDGDPSDGCEVDLTSTTASCGRCDNACSVAGGTAACERGTCTVASCGADFSDCDGNPANGCETDLRASAANCGMCGNLCPSRPHAAGTCAARVCSTRCDAGFTDCDMDPVNGCEVDTRSTTTSCGACGHTCTATNGTAGCSAGACTLATCNTGFADCDRVVSNGCETNITTSAANCGACGMRGVEVCDGRDNTCDGRIDEGCPTGLAGIDAISATSTTFGTTVGTVAYDMTCPPGTFAAGVTGRLYSGYYQSQWQFRCVRPRLVENSGTTPYTYSIAWDAAGTAGPVGAATGTAFTFDCPADSVIHRMSPYVFLQYISQVTWECASWSVAGSTTAGWHVARTVTRSTAIGVARGSRYDYTCPDASGNASALRSIFGRFYSPYAFSSVALRCSSPSVTVR